MVIAIKYQSRFGRFPFFKGFKYKIKKGKIIGTIHISCKHKLFRDKLVSKIASWLMMRISFIPYLTTNNVYLYLKFRSFEKFRGYYVGLHYFWLRVLVIR